MFIRIFANAIFFGGLLLFATHLQAASTNTITQTCTVNGVQVDCATGQPLNPSAPPRSLFCPERVYEVIYGRYCDHRSSKLEYHAVKIMQAYGGGGFDLGTGLKAAYGMNDNTDIVGTAVNSSGEVHAVKVQIGASYYSDHYFQDLGEPGVKSEARAINNIMTIVGASQIQAGSRKYYETIWHSQVGFNYPLYTLGTNGGVAVDLARNRMYTEYVTGYSTLADKTIHGFVWSFDGQQQTVDEIGEPGQDTYAIAINDSKVVVGYVRRSRYTFDPFVWRNGTMTLIPDFPYRSVAQAINNNASPKVLGRARNLASGGYDVFVWQDSNTTVLPVLEGQNYNLANAISDGGDIVGESGESAVIWRDNVIYDLNTLLDAPLGTNLNNAIDINRQGRILVRADDGFYYLLVPTEDLVQ